MCTLYLFGRGISDVCLQVKSRSQSLLLQILSSLELKTRELEGINCTNFLVTTLERYERLKYSFISRNKYRATLETLTLPLHDSMESGCVLLLA